MSETPRDPHDEVTRVRRSPDDPRDGRAGDGGRGGGGHGWMLATVGLLALVLGIGAGLLINGSDEKTRTVRTGVRTVVSTTPAASTPASSIGVTVTQPVETVERTVTIPPVTVTAPAGATTDDEQP